MYHHNKTYLRQLAQHRIHPYVFHMCWTSNRDEKVGRLGVGGGHADRCSSYEIVS